MIYDVLAHLKFLTLVGTGSNSNFCWKCLAAWTENFVTNLFVHYGFMLIDQI